MASFSRCLFKDYVFFLIWRRFRCRFFKDGLIWNKVFLNGWFKNKVYDVSKWRWFKDIGLFSLCVVTSYTVVKMAFHFYLIQFITNHTRSFVFKMALFEFKMSDGCGATIEDAHDDASLKALRALSDLGIENGEAPGPGGDVWVALKHFLYSHTVASPRLI